MENKIAEVETWVDMAGVAKLLTAKKRPSGRFFNIMYFTTIRS